MYVKLDGKTYKIHKTQEGSFIKKSTCKTTSMPVPANAVRINKLKRNSLKSSSASSSASPSPSPSPRSGLVSPVLVPSPASPVPSPRQLKQTQEALAKLEAENERLQLNLSYIMTLKASADQRITRDTANYNRVNDELKVVRMENRGLLEQLTDMTKKLQAHQTRQQRQRQQVEQLKQMKQAAQAAQASQSKQQKQTKQSTQKKQQSEDSQLLEQFKAEAKRIITSLKEENDTLRESVQEINKLYEQTEEKYAFLQSKHTKQAKQTQQAKQAKQIRQSQEADKTSMEMRSLKSEQDKLKKELKSIKDAYEDLEKEYTKIYQDLLEARRF